MIVRWLIEARSEEVRVEAETAKSVGGTRQWFFPRSIPGVSFQPAVDDRGLNVKKVLRPSPAANHLLLLAHAPVDELIDSRFLSRCT